LSEKWIKVRSSEGGGFDCYLNVPEIGRQVPAVVLASAVHGVDADIVAIADEFAAQGFIAAAPDLFWRTVPGPLPHDDGRAQQRSQPRLEKIQQGEADMADTLARLGEVPEFNGSAVAMGFCYGGPYAIPSGRNALATLPAFPATAPRCSITCTNSRTSPSLFASCGAIGTTELRTKY
jgi:carboxymethylenebutenolidase